MQKAIQLFCTLVLTVSISVHAQEQNQKTRSLSSLIELALASNHELQKLELEQEGTNVRKKLVNSTFIPSVGTNAMLGVGQFGISDMSLGLAIPAEIQSMGAALAPALGMSDNPIPPEYNTTINLEYNDLQIFTAGVKAEWVLFTGMKATHAKRGLRHKYNAQQQLVNKQASEIVAEVVYYHDKLMLIRHSESVIESSRKRLDKEKARVESAFLQGILTRYDVEKISLAELELQAKTLELNNNKKLVILKLKQLCGVSESEIIALGDDPTQILNDNAHISANERPELRALYEKGRGLEEKLKMANSAYLPKIAAIANYQYADLDLAKVNPVAFVGVGAKWELFDGLKTSREKQLIRLEIEQERHEREHIQDLLELDTEMKKTRIVQTAARLDIKSKQVEKSELALHTKNGEYAQGLCDIGAWLEAENDFQKAQLEYYQTRFEMRHAQLEWQSLSGDLHNTYQQLID